jgi:uncharacterized SAM-binding protein YcdF (DUF218 family)
MGPVLGVKLIAAIAAALVVSWLAASGVLFVWPHEDTARRSDAMVVLAGSKHERLDKALSLMRQGLAPVLLISAGDDPAWPAADRLCGQSRPFRVVCFDAHPFNTRGEAQAVTRMAAAHGWRSLVVVTSSYHVTRARLIFERCFHGQLAAVGAPTSIFDLPGDIASEWAKLVYSLTVTRRC